VTGFKTIATENPARISANRARFNQPLFLALAQSRKHAKIFQGRCVALDLHAGSDLF
jgi:hypothetical protein